MIRRSLLGPLLIIASLIAVQISSAGSASAIGSFSSYYSKPCSNLTLYLTVDTTHTASAQFAYNGSSCGPIYKTTQVNAYEYQCRGDGTACGLNGQWASSNWVNAANFTSEVLTRTTSFGHLYKFCMSLINTANERYINVCTVYVSDDQRV